MPQDYKIAGVPGLKNYPPGYYDPTSGRAPPPSVLSPKTTKKINNAITNTAKKIGTGISNAAKAVRKTVVNTVRTTTTTIKKAATTVVNKAATTIKKVGSSLGTALRRFF